MGIGAIGHVHGGGGVRRAQDAGSADEPKAAKGADAPEGGGGRRRRAQAGEDAAAGAEQVGGGTRRGGAGKADAGDDAAGGGGGGDKAGKAEGGGKAHKHRRKDKAEGGEGGGDAAGAAEGGGGKAAGAKGGGGCGGADGADKGTTALGPTGAPVPTDIAAEVATATALAPLTGTGLGAADPATAAIAAPVAAPAAAGTGAALIQTAAGALQGSPLAQQVLQAIQAGGAKIDVVPDAQFAQEYGRAAGVFDPQTNAISLPESVAKDPTRLRLILLHEGVHWLQDNTKGGLDALGGPIAQALNGAGAVRQTQPNSKDDLQHDEAQAYLLEALTANQLGFEDKGLGVDRSGKAMSYAQILQAVKSTPEYA